MVAVFLSYGLNENKLLDYFRSSGAARQIKREVFFLMWGLAVFTSFTGLIVNLAFPNFSRPNFNYCRTLISDNYGHLYWIALLLSTLSFFFSLLKPDYLIFDIVFTFLFEACAFFVLFEVYWRTFSSKPRAIKQWVYLGLDINLSLLTSWFLCLLLMQFSSYFETRNISENTREWILILTNCILSGSCIVFLNLKQDFYFTAMIIVFQIGNLLQKMAHDKDVTFIVLCLVFSCATFLFYLMFPKMEETQMDYERLLQKEDLEE